MWVRVCTLEVLLIANLACAARPISAVRSSPYTKLRPIQAPLTIEDEASIERNCPYGMPRAASGFPHGQTRFVTRFGYALEHSSFDRVPLWVCEAVVEDDLRGTLPRTNPFAPDPKLATAERSELSDYKGSGYDRGHQAPAGDQTVDSQRKDETFFLSNMAPQVGAFNQRIWAYLEDVVRQWVLTGHLTDLKVITGPLWYDPAEDDEATADGQIQYLRIKDRLSVPTHFFKILTATVDGRTQAIAFVFENKSYGNRRDVESFIRAVRWIEDRAGFDFMPDLDALTQQDIETKPSVMWSIK